jgi:pepF/M3 family oligoendopeptidase
MNNDAAQAALSELMQANAQLAQLQSRMTAWIGSLDVEALIATSPVARANAFLLREAVTDAAHLMSPAEEALAAELAPSGAGAWCQLQQQIDASLTAEFEVDGEVVTLPLTEIERYFSDPDRSLRRRAYEVNRDTLHAVRVPLAAAINGVKGEQSTLTRRRKWADPLDAALRLNRIDRATLDAMMSAINAATPDLRRYLRAKATALGLPKLASYDLFAPIGETGDTWPYNDAVRFVTDQFATYSPALAALAERSTAERWIDAGPREGKVGGGFCTGVGNGASRILLNYTPNFLWMSAIAHELGHAYHVHAMHAAGRAFLQQAGNPATLAETASTFCETLVQVQALAHVAPADRLELLNGVIQGQVINVFLTGIGYATEQAIFAARQERQLSPDELTEIVLTAQRELFGDEVDPETLWRYQWASVPHYFLPDIWYYNFPYAFGMLFGLGLYATYRADPEPFIAGFDSLLADTGMATAAELAARFEIDLHAPSFWESGLATIRANIAHFEELVNQSASPGV